MDYTATIITTLISLITIISVVRKFIANQTRLETQLLNIQKELVEIKEKLDRRDNDIRQISDRILTLENCEKYRSKKEIKEV
jgi:peptidoglycan hydrolase CwlO-like protein